MGRSKYPDVSSFFWFIVPMAALVICLGACSTLQISSQWQGSEVKIDGKANEWQDDLFYVENENFFFGVRNNDTFLYVCLYSEDPMMGNMLLFRGLTVWFDPAGGKSTVFGFRFPVGTQDIMQQLSEEERRKIQEQMQQGDRSFRSRMTQEMMNQGQILGSGQDNVLPVQIAELKGIEVRLSLSGGVLVYELKVPLSASSHFPYAVGTVPGQPLGIGFDIPKMSRRLGSSGMRGGGAMGGGRIGDSGEGMGGGMAGGRSGGGMRGGVAGSRGGMMNGLKFWAKVDLARAVAGFYE